MNGGQYPSYRAIIRVYIEVELELVVHAFRANGFFVANVGVSRKTGHSSVILSKTPQDTTR